jgi:membrane associated rhomboid family serine protease
MSNFRFTRPEAFPPVIKNLIIINVLVFVAQILFEKDFNLTSKLGMWPIGTELFKPYQIFTHMFTHSTTVIFHIVFNMFALWMFGRILENVWGPKRFLTFYLICGLGAAATHLAVGYFETQRIMEEVSQLQAAGEHQLALETYFNGIHPVVGASGAVMGVMVGFAFLFPNTPLYIMFIPVPIKAKWAILGFVALDLFGGINPSQGDSVAHFAHLGGALTGFIIVYIWNKTNKRTLY